MLGKYNPTRVLSICNLTGVNPIKHFLLYFKFTLSIFFTKLMVLFTGGVGLFRQPPWQAQHSSKIWTLTLNPITTVDWTAWDRPFPFIITRVLHNRVDLCSKMVIGDKTKCPLKPSVSLSRVSMHLVDL